MKIAACASILSTVKETLHGKSSYLLYFLWEMLLLTIVFWSLLPTNKNYCYCLYSVMMMLNRGLRVHCHHIHLNQHASNWLKLLTSSEVEPLTSHPCV